METRIIKTSVFFTSGVSAEKYIVQKKVIRGFWIFKKEVWETEGVSYNGFDIIRHLFNTLEEAKIYERRLKTPDICVS